MTQFYVESSLPFTFSKVNSLLQSNTKLMLVVLSFVIHSAVFADYTINAGVTTNANTINTQSGTLHIYGTMEVTTDVTFTSPNPIVVILYGPSGRILWSANKTLALPVGSTISFVNSGIGEPPLGLVGSSAASQILQIGDVKYAAANDNSNNTLFSFDQINLIGGSASLAPSIAPYCFGDPIPMLANPVIPQNSTIRVLWSTISGNGTFSVNDNSAAVSTVLTNMPLGIDTIITELFVLAGGTNYILAARTKIPLNVKPKYTWLGINTNWNDPINWCPSVPGSTTDVTIPSVASNVYPVFDNYTGSVRNITIASNASVTVNGTGVLQIAGTIINNGTFNTTSGSLVFNGTSAQTISGNDFSSKTLKNLTVSNNAGLSVSAPPKDTLNITGTLSFGTNSATLYTGNNITLKSTASGTANVGQLAPGNIITGDVIVERHISLGRKWRLLSVPTNGIQTFKQAWQEGATTANPNPNPGFGILIGHPNNTTYAGLGFDIFAPGGSTVKTYNSTTDAWVGISTTNNPISTLGGYMTFIVGNRSTPVTPLTNTSSTTIRTIGNLKQQQQEVTIPMNKYAVVGNPYASPVALARINRTNVQNSFVVWDPKLTGPTSAYGLGAFQYLTSEPDDSTTYTATPGGGSYPDDLSPVTSIESGLAFFMKAESTGNGTVTFHEATKSTGENISVFKTENTIAYKRLVARLYAARASGTGIVDAVVARFGEAYSNAYNDEDILKIANTGENLSIENNNKSLVIDNRNSLNANDTIHLKLSGVRVQNYIWKLDLKNMAETGLEAFLLDKYLQVSTPLLTTGQTLINFSIANIPGSYAPDRFKIVFKTAVLLPVNITSISANRNNDKTVSVLWKVQQELNLTGYEVQRSLDGSTFVSIITQSPDHNNGGAMSYQAVDRGVAEGDLYYRIKANSISGQVQYSAIVKVAALKQNSSISVYPNPVVGGQVHLRFIAQPLGRYQVQLTNAAGQVMYNAAIEVSNALQSENIPLPPKTAGGQYQLRAIKPDGRAYTQQVFVE